MAMNDAEAALLGRKTAELEAMGQEYDKLLGLIDDVLAGRHPVGTVYVIDRGARTWSFTFPETKAPAPEAAT